MQTDLSKRIFKPGDLIKFDPNRRMNFGLESHFDKVFIVKAIIQDYFHVYVQLAFPVSEKLDQSEWSQARFKLFKEAC